MKEELAEKNLEIGLCHGAFHNHHLNNGELEVFDFDFTAIGYRSYDVAVSWWNLLHNDKRQEQECWDSFLQGYLSQRELTKDDLQSVPLFTLYAEYGC
ncbi:MULTISPECIES: phosphotransferase [Virgibacillus]|uniref:phosphotransferase n=1 Tax=Virgibacillus TaxID=84406 RepID=UPI0031BA7956